MAKIFDTISSLFSKVGNIIPVVENSKNSPKELSTHEAFELAKKFNIEKFPTRFSHVVISNEDECEDITYTCYSSTTTISSQNGYSGRIPYVERVEPIYKNLLKYDGKRYSVSELKKQINSIGIKLETTECSIDSIPLQIDENGICAQQEDMIVKKSTSICSCPDCRGKGYSICPEEECKGRHQYKCSACKGKGEFVCEECHGRGEVICNRCDGKGDYLCKTCKGEGFFKCPECKGKQTIICKHCKGNGEEICRRCQGKGHVGGNRCSDCAGKGTIRCKKCNGRGISPCQTCYGKGEIRCQDCNGEGRIICTKCHGDKSVRCESCRGSGMLTCHRCNGAGEIICSTCLGDKEHYGMVECPSCITSGKLVQFNYVTTSIKKMNIEEIPRIKQLKNQSLKELYKPTPQTVIYTNINGKKHLTEDDVALKISEIIDKKIEISKDSKNPSIVKQELTYQNIRCIFIKCKHILAQKEFNIAVLDVLGQEPQIVFPNYDDIKPYKASFLQAIGLCLSQLFKTKKYLKRKDIYSRYKLFILMAKADGHLDDAEKRKIANDFIEINELSPNQKNELWKILNSSSVDDVNVQDIAFSSKEVAENVLKELEILSSIDNNVDINEKKLLEQIRLLIQTQQNK